MSRITTPATVESSPAAAQPSLAAVQKQLGSVPNLFRIVANSPAALEGYLGLSGALGRGSLDVRTRQRIALAVAELNGCNYRLSAHTYLGEHVAKPDATEMAANRDGASAEAKAAAALRFATRLVRARGHVSEADVAAVKAAGYGDAEVVEIIAHVALNTLTNYVNSALGTDIDFPVVEAKPAYDGLCAVAVSMGERVPSDTTSSSRHDGRLFRFSSAEAKAMFDAAPSTYVEKADARWAKLR
jgi:uncharacterized peroxidase-related enzyme